MIASGGLASIDGYPARCWSRAPRKLAGAIAGRALYDGRLNAGEALRAASARREPVAAE